MHTHMGAYTCVCSSTHTHGSSTNSFSSRHTYVPHIHANAYTCIYTSMCTNTDQNIGSFDGVYGDAVVFVSGVDQYLFVGFGTF